MTFTEVMATRGVVSALLPPQAAMSTDSAVEAARVSEAR
jgi:hypothetical protein